MPSQARSRAATDGRVRSAAAVLAGLPLDDVAAQAGVDNGQLLRWADALAEGGAAAVGGLGLERPAAGTAETVPVEDFLTVVAHELRTPLTAARSSLRVLASPDVDPALRTRIADTVLGRLAQLDRLTLDVLDAVEIVTGRGRLAPERVDLTAVVDAACATAGCAGPSPAAVHVWADAGRLGTVAATLLTHALRYAAPAEVAVRVQALPDAALLTVRLGGVEGNPEQARALFEPFAAAARGDGNGLALYVVRALAVASGGSVGVAGEGGSAPATVIWVRLPLAAPPLRPDAPALVPPADPHR